MNSTIISNCIAAAEFAKSLKLSDPSQVIATLTQLLNSMGGDPDPETSLRELDLLCQTHGVEEIIIPEYSSEPLALYLNAGDTYNLTAIYDCIREEYDLTTYGDMVELFDRFGDLAREMEAFADNIDWEEWTDIYPVRLRYFEHQYSLCWGDPSWDNDHRGIWATSSLVPNMAFEDYLETILDLYRDL